MGQHPVNFPINLLGHVLVNLPSLPQTGQDLSFDKSILVKGRQRVRTGRGIAILVIVVAVIEGTIGDIPFYST